MNKMRYSIPAKIIELLFNDDTFYNDVLKIKKASSNKYPKSDEWVDERGFNLSFALAGYSPGDIQIEVLENILIIRGNGIDSIVVPEERAGGLVDFDPNIIRNSLQPDSEGIKSNDSESEYQRESRPRIHVGLISRGIARRSFCVKYLISEEFDPFKATALMEHGLLHVLIPVKEAVRHIQIEIKGEK